MLLHGYTKIKNDTFFTHIIGFDEEILVKINKNNFRYDSGEILGVASFLHHSQSDYEKFVNDFNINIVDSKEELQMLKKLTT